MFQLSGFYCISRVQLESCLKHPQSSTSCSFPSQDLKVESRRALVECERAFRENAWGPGLVLT